MLGCFRLSVVFPVFCFLPFFLPHERDSSSISTSMYSQFVFLCYHITRVMGCLVKNIFAFAALFFCCDFPPPPLGGLRRVGVRESEVGGGIERTVCARVYHGGAKAPLIEVSVESERFAVPFGRCFRLARRANTCQRTPCEKPSAGLRLAFRGHYSTEDRAAWRSIPISHSTPVN